MPTEAVEEYLIERGRFFALWRTAFGVDARLIRMFEALTTEEQYEVNRWVMAEMRQHMEDANR